MDAQQQLLDERHTAIIERLDTLNDRTRISERDIVVLSNHGVFR